MMRSFVICPLRKKKGGLGGIELRGDGLGVARCWPREGVGRFGSEGCFDAAQMPYQWNSTGAGGGIGPM